MGCVPPRETPQSSPLLSPCRSSADFLQEECFILTKCEERRAASQHFPVHLRLHQDACIAHLTNLQTEEGNSTPALLTTPFLLYNGYRMLAFLFKQLDFYASTKSTHQPKKHFHYFAPPTYIFQHLSTYILKYILAIVFVLFCTSMSSLHSSPQPFFLQEMAPAIFSSKNGPP